MTFKPLSFVVVLISVTLVATASFDLCGRPRTSGGLLFGGNKATKSQFPWLVVLHHPKEDIYFCAGNIIAIKHILTAAHCVHRKGDAVALEPNEIKVYVGRHDLDDEDEIDGNDKVVSEIIIHQDWKPSETNFDADIAILKLQDKLVFSIRVQPICLPTSNEIVENGALAGWGLNENSGNRNKMEGLPRFAIIDVPERDDCYLGNSTLAPLMSRVIIVVSFVLYQLWNVRLFYREPFAQGSRMRILQSVLVTAIAASIF